MSSYVYHKKSASRFRLKNKKIIAKSFGFLCILVGIVMSLYFFFPVLSYQLFISPVFAQGDIEVPIPKYMVTANANFGGLLTQSLSSITHDYTDARNWYPQLSAQEKSQLIERYSLSIPKLKIENAEVSTRDYDLSEHLVHYGGTSNPGEKGTAVVFGHSTLPQLFDPKNYKAIFATLHTIKVGDEIVVNMDGTKLKYKVFAMGVTTPDDMNIFSQSFDNSYLTLVTCTPPGTVWKRLVIRASLEGMAT